jgi:hypothetical protein
MHRQIALTLLLLALSASVSAAEFSCSIRPAKDIRPTQMQGLAKVTQAEAQKAALAKIKASSTKIESSELEVEQGCLVYSFDIGIAGKRGVEEIVVDAGTGKILSHKHESAKQEAAERAKDSAALRKQ